LSEWFGSRLAVSKPDLVRTFRSFNAYAEAFRKESEAHENPHH
jgi:sulfhydrogenase subunit delta